MTDDDTVDGRSLKASGCIQGELFVVDGLDVVAKDDLVSMEHAFYSLTKKPVTKLDPYEYKEHKIEFRPSQAGFPTIYDKDLVIYAVSCVIAKMTAENVEPPRYVTFNPHDFLVFTGRSTGGRAYDALCDSVDRLKGSYFKTNIPINGQVKHSWRSIIGDVELLVNAKTNKPQQITIQLSDMLIETIKNKGVLTLNRDYFRIKKPIERRIYQLARKHAGHQPTSWKVNLDTLHKKSGSRGSLREFRRAVKNLASTDDLPDYHTAFDEGADQLSFTRKASFVAAYKPKPAEPDEGLPGLKPAVIAKVKSMCPRNVCVYQLEADWRDYWAKNGRKPLDDHNAAFIGWSKKIIGQNDHANA